MPYKDREKQLQAQHDHYVNNKSDYQRRRGAYKQRNREYIYDYLDQHSCVICGEDDPVVLEFDHRNPEEKSFGVSSAVTRRVSLKKLQEEIDKCDVLCANCHRRKTAQQFEWFGHTRKQNPQ